MSNVSEQTLLEGSWFALEQAGRLLHSAKVLFEIGDFSTAVAVAMFSREELGRSRLLRDCSRDVRKGQVLQAKDITKRCQDHVVKQNASVGTNVLRTTNDTKLGKAFQTQMEYAPSSEQWKRAESFINSAHEAKQKSSQMSVINFVASAFMLISTLWGQIGRAQSRFLKKKHEITYTMRPMIMRLR